MPNISLVELAKILIKLTLIALLTTVIISFVGNFTTMIIQVISNLTGSLNSVNGVNLGWFANAIGLVSMLNSLMQSLYIAGSILISGVVTILSFKFGIRFYENLMRV